MKQAGNLNPVKKNMDKFHKPVTHRNKKQLAKRGYKKHKKALWKKIYKKKHKIAFWHRNSEILRLLCCKCLLASIEPVHRKQKTEYLK